MLGVYREDGPGRLLEVLETVPDPRSAHGLRHPLGAVLALSSLCDVVRGAQFIRHRTVGSRASRVSRYLGLHQERNSLCGDSAPAVP